MVYEEQIIRIDIPEYAMDRARFHATHACIGGRSSVRGGTERQQSLQEDQLVGQLGQVALHLYMFGDLHRYETSRWMQNQFPTSGDGGFDVPGLPMDVKTSLIRSQLPLIKHRLLVRPRERHADNVYALALVSGATVWLVGWAADAELPADPEQSGVFKGAYLLPAERLHPFPPLRYDWVEVA